MTELSRRTLGLALAAALAGTGCIGGGGDAAELEEVGPYAVGDTVGDAAVPAALPLSLTCVSGPVGDDEVLRVSIARGAEGLGSVSITQGPQFWSHLGVWADAAGTTDVRDVAVSDDGAILLEGDANGLELQLQRDGLMVRGSLLRERSAGGKHVALTCWNELELFGSPWSGQVGLLPAHFDWQVGTCVNEGGLPAFNDVPIELVRETGHAECADLRGASLNGGDSAEPDLWGWALVGARLDGATLTSAHLRGASLHGADLSGIELGDATIDGLIDTSTVLPRDQGVCEVTENPWAGTFVRCAR